MRYFAITVVTFAVMIGINMIVGSLLVVDRAFDIETQLTEDQQQFAKLKLLATELLLENVDLTGDNARADTLLVLPPPVPNHPWIESRSEHVKESADYLALVQHLKRYSEQFANAETLKTPAGRAWLEEYLRQLVALQAQRLALSRFLLDSARAELMTDAIRAGVMIAAIVSFVFLFVFLGQRRNLLNSRQLNNTLRVQRETLLASQRAMLSITSDEKRANQRAEQLASIVEQSSEAIVRLNHTGHVEHANRSAAKLFPGLRTLSPNDRFSKLFVGDARRQVETGIQATLRSNTPTTLTIEHRPDEHLEISITQLQSNGDSGMSIMTRDITTRRHEQKRLEQVMENAPNALIVCDAEARITMVNHQAELLLGYNSEELIGSPPDLLLSARQRLLYLAHRDNYLQNPVNVKMGDDGGITVAHKNGEEFPVTIGLNPMRIGEQLLVIASAFDLREQQKQKDSLAKLNQQLAVRNEEMEQFIYTVSHDLKSPLFTISGFTQRLKESIEQVTPDQQHQIQRIQANVERMGRLLEDLLQISRVIRVELKYSAVDLNKLVESVIGSMESSIQHADGKVQVKSPLGTVYGHEGMVFQCLQNLITNSLKYTQGGIAPVITISSSEEGDKVIVSVKDNGTGIDIRHHQSIFKIFQRLDQREGTGVGLSIVKTIMERHGGEVSVDSAKGQGSTFHLIFPRTAPTEVDGLTEHKRLH